jgi:hemerythrin-like metal-binding protein
MYKWTPDLSLGNEAIDKEHQQLFELLDRYYNGLINNGPRMELLELIKNMLDYAQTHFANEEALMYHLNYPDIQHHIALHRTFGAKAIELYDKVNQGRLVLTLEVTNFIKDWLIEHIKAEDFKLIIYAKSSGLSATFHN